MSEGELIAMKLLPPWDETKCRVCGWSLDPGGKFCRRSVAVMGELVSDCSLRPLPEARADAPPDFATLDGCRLFEEALFEKLSAGAYRYGQILTAIRCGYEDWQDGPVFDCCLKATPAQRVAACVRVIQEAGL
jgi:hypothetical protein